MRLKKKTEDIKDRMENIEKPIDEQKISDSIDQIKSHMANLENAINRLGK